VDINFVIDWLSVTLRHWPGPWPYFDLATAEAATPRFGYETSWQDGNGSIAYSGGNAGTIHLVWSGSALNALREQGTSMSDMLHVLNGVGARFTRLDIAADWRDSGTSVAKLAKLIERDLAELKVKRWTFLQSEGGGETLYLGSRFSERMIRIYNKAAQFARTAPGDFNDWIRVEAELKDRQAEAAAKALIDNTPGSVLAGHLDKVVYFTEYAPWKEFVARLPSPAPVILSQRGVTNTDKWLIETVLPTLQKRLKDPGFADLWWSMLIET